MPDDPVTLSPDALAALRRELEGFKERRDVLMQHVGTHPGCPECENYRGVTHALALLPEPPKPPTVEEAHELLNVLAAPFTDDRTAAVAELRRFIDAHARCGEEK